MQTKAIFDSDTTFRTFQRRICERDFFKASFCRDILFRIAGANPDNFDLVDYFLISLIKNKVIYPCEKKQ